MNTKIPILFSLMMLIPLFAQTQIVKADFSKTSVFIDVTAVENIANKYGVDGRTFVYDQLSALYGTYQISCMKIHLHFGIFPDTTLSAFTSKLQNYVSYFHSRVWQIIVSIAKVKHTGTLWTDGEIDQWYSSIANVLNQYSSVILFIGEYELCSNNTCPICGAPSPQKIAFQNNFENLKNYGVKLHNKWHQYSSIPFSIGECLPFDVSVAYIYTQPWYYVHGDYWFSIISKSSFEQYILGSSDVLTFTVWNQCNAINWLKTLAETHGKSICISEINMPYELGLSNIISTLSPYLIAYCWYDLINYNKLTIYDWACQSHMQTNSKYNWFAVSKALFESNIPHGSKVGVLTQWMDRSLRDAYYVGGTPIQNVYCQQTVYAYRAINVQTGAYRALEVNVYFDAISYSDTYPSNYICFARVEVDSSRWFSIGAKVWTGGAFDMVYEWVSSSGSLYSVSVPFGADSYNRWLNLKIYQSGSTVVIVCNSWSQTFSNGYTGSLTFTSVKFGDWNNKVACSMLIDDLKIWTSSNGVTWSVAFQESFENGLSGWTLNVAGESNQRANNFPAMIIADDWTFIDHVSVYPLIKVY